MVELVESKNTKPVRHFSRIAQRRPAPRSWFHEIVYHFATYSRRLYELCRIAYSRFRCANCKYFVDDAIETMVLVVPRHTQSFVIFIFSQPNCLDLSMRLCVYMPDNLLLTHIGLEHVPEIINNARPVDDAND